MKRLRNIEYSSLLFRLAIEYLGKFIPPAEVACSFRHLKTAGRPGEPLPTTITFISKFILVGMNWNSETIPEGMKILVEQPPTHHLSYEDGVLRYEAWAGGELAWEEALKLRHRRWLEMKQEVRTLKLSAERVFKEYAESGREGVEWKKMKELMDEGCDLILNAEEGG